MCTQGHLPVFKKYLASSKGVEDSGFIFRDKDRRGSCSPPILVAAKGKGDGGKVLYPLYWRPNLRGSWKSSWIVPH